MSFYTCGEKTPWNSNMGRNTRISKNFYTNTIYITYKRNNNHVIRWINVCILDDLLKEKTTFYFLKTYILKLSGSRIINRKRLFFV